MVDVNTCKLPSVCILNVLVPINVFLRSLKRSMHRLEGEIQEQRLKKKYNLHEYHRSLRNKAGSYGLMADFHPDHKIDLNSLVNGLLPIKCDPKQKLICLTLKTEYYKCSFDLKCFSLPTHFWLFGGCENIRFSSGRTSSYVKISGWT